ncbi:hypothetical protein V1477_011508 [Vespula maculifrons]|uniref:Uncharacterized protein n=1 Tax=Vespula maculifrons TaxID=7453 RepID=A0ABD2C012_VESMC
MLKKEANRGSLNTVYKSKGGVSVDRYLSLKECVTSATRWAKYEIETTNEQLMLQMDNADVI